MMAHNKTTLEQLMHTATVQLHLVKETRMNIFHDTPVIGVTEEYLLGWKALEVHSDHKEAARAAKAYARSEREIQEGLYEETVQDRVTLRLPGIDYEFRGEIEHRYKTSTISVPVKDLHEERDRLFLDIQGVSYEVQ